MESEQDNNKGFFQERTEKIITKVEKTPMEKFFVFFLILISVSAVVLGFMQFKKDIEGPALSSYLDRKRGELIQKYQASSVDTEEELVSRLKNQDSDLDGLDDWSEINVYGTSPYLSDTDNDGLNDKQEITRGSNPNCPEGLDCSLISSTPLEAALTSEVENINSIISNIGDTDMQTMMQYEQELLAGTITLEQLGINNPELQKIFDEMKNVPADPAANLNSAEKNQAIEELKNMTPAQLREEMISRGMDKATLDQMDDQTLMDLLDQIISTYQ
jgi:hypothetical protein